MTLFLKTYQNVILSIIVFFLTFFIVSTQNKSLQKIHSFILFCGVFLMSFEIISIVFRTQFIEVFKHFFQQEVVDAYMINIDRGRSSFESNNELFIPFFLFSGSASLLFKYKYMGIGLLTIFLSVFSNNRTRFISVLFALGAYFYFVIGKRVKNTIKIVVFLCVFIFVIGTATLASRSMNELTIFSRFTLDETSSDYASQNFRIESLKQSISIALQKPITGIGLGNYYYFNLIKGVNYKDSTTAKSYERRYHEQVNYSPHNIFAQTLAETGFLGFISLMMILIYFLRRDFFLIVVKKKLESFQYIIASWIVFISMFLNPPQTLFINGWFWFLRGIVEAI